MATYNSASTKPIYYGTQIVWFIFGAIEILLALRFMLKLLGANPAALFTDSIYGITTALVNPFTTVFGATYQSGSIFEWTTLLAAFIYAIIAYGIISLLLMSQDVSTIEAASLRNQE